MPDPFIWGVVTFVLEFIPYLGGVIIVGLLLIDGFFGFPDAGAGARRAGHLSRHLDDPEQRRVALCLRQSPQAETRSR